MNRVLTRNNVTVSGRGTTPIIFAHGFGCNQQMWRHVAPAFEQDFSVVLFDYVGCGDSDRSAYDVVRYAELGGYAQDILDICEALGLEDVIFVGHSVSSVIGMLAAQQQRGLFKTMVMLGPSACYLNEPGYAGGFEPEDLEYLVTSVGNGQDWPQVLARAVAGNPGRPALSEELAQSFCSLDPAVAQQFARASFLVDYRPLLPAHEVPTLVLQSEQDPIAPVSAGEYISRYLRHSTMIQLPVTGHVPHLSDPEPVVRAMWDHLFDSRGLAGVNYA